MLSLLFNRIIKPNKKMKNQKEKIEFNQDLYTMGIYDAYITDNDEHPFELTSVKNEYAIGWVGEVASGAHITKLYLAKRPRKVWVHIVESIDGALFPKLTEYPDYTPYKGSVIRKTYEAEV
jgi:hypothetical protein